MANLAGTVGVPSGKAGDGLQTAMLGRQLEQFVAEIHGKWFYAAMAGKLFQGSALIAGVTIPVNTTTAPTFTLFNPSDSGVNVELVSLDIGWPAAAASVVGTILGSVGRQTPTSTTVGGVTIPYPIGAGGAARAQLFTAATIAAITSHIPLIGISTVVDTMNPSHVEFDGRVTLAPGGLITLTSTPAQTAVALPSFCWAEWPV